MKVIQLKVTWLLLALLPSVALASSDSSSETDAQFIFHPSHKAVSYQQTVMPGFFVHDQQHPPYVRRQRGFPQSEPLPRSQVRELPPRPEHHRSKLSSFFFGAQPPPPPPPPIPRRRPPPPPQQRQQQQKQRLPFSVPPPAPPLPPPPQQEIVRIRKQHHDHRSRSRHRQTPQDVREESRIQLFTPEEGVKSHHHVVVKKKPKGVQPSLKTYPAVPASSTTVAASSTTTPVPTSRRRPSTTSRATTLKARRLSSSTTSRTTTPDLVVRRKKKRRNHRHRHRQELTNDHEEDDEEEGADEEPEQATRSGNYVRGTHLRSASYSSIRLSPSAPTKAPESRILFKPKKLLARQPKARQAVSKTTEAPDSTSPSSEAEAPSTARRTRPTLSSSFSSSTTTVGTASNAPESSTSAVESTTSSPFRRRFTNYLKARQSLTGLRSRSKGEDISNEADEASSSSTTFRPPRVASTASILTRIKKLRHQQTRIETSTSKSLTTAKISVSSTASSGSSKSSSATTTEETTTTSLEEESKQEDLSSFTELNPCEPQNHVVIVNQTYRSFNHHLSLGDNNDHVEKRSGCDSDLKSGWYRFISPAGEIMPTECPGGNYCGTNRPVWMKGSIPSAEDGTVSATGCINQDRECCTSEIPIQVRNCSAFIVYHLEPTPSCLVGYCMGEGVLCPEGLASANGYTPCEFSVKLEDVLISFDETDAASFMCMPILKNVISPTTVEVEMEWWVADKMVGEESFILSNKTSGTLDASKWVPGQEIRCMARAKHSIIGAKTDKKTSKAISAGIKIVSQDLVLDEGGSPGEIQIRSSVPITCPQKESFFSQQNCCLELEVNLREDSNDQFCPNGKAIQRLELPSCGARICASDWNKTVSIPLRVRDDHLINGDDTLLVTVNIKDTDLMDTAGLELQEQKITIIGAPPEEVCRLSPTLHPFFNDGEIVTPGIYTVYRSTRHPVEIQVHYKACSLSKLCACAIAIRVDDAVVIFDVCTKGHMQVWAWHKEGVKDEDSLPDGLSIVSIDEGRSFKVFLPSGTYISLGSMLQSIRIFAARKDAEYSQGLCSRLNTKSWRKSPKKSLFTAFFDPSLNSTIDSDFDNCLLCPDHKSTSCSKDRNVGCEGPTEELYNSQALFLGQNADFMAFTNVVETSADAENSSEVLEAGAEVETSDAVAQIFLSISGPQRDPPSEGWTMTNADKFCGEFIRNSPAAEKCLTVPDLDLASVIVACRTDLLYSGDSRVSGLHLDRLKSECMFSLFRNTSLWEKVDSNRLSPPPSIANVLCLNDCSGHGICNKGNCECDPDYVGPDCSQALGVTLRHKVTQEGPKPPQISALANFGLCDVRSAPCRDIIVLGDGIVNHESLMCNFVIYKIRGVASKQLVSDAEFTVPAKFISYQQVLCSLPKLAIHSPDEITNLDLKENTDHTRVFSQITLSYGSGPNSAPLDLLLYDSLCWDCDASSGECKGKAPSSYYGNRGHQCFFAGGSVSAAQVFRIGRTISTRVSQEDFRICTLPKDSGGCANKIFRYYYNAIERRCKLFVYGGCKGNKNNFLSEIECLQRCGDESQLALLPVEGKATTEIDTCSQVRDEGICPGNVPRFYFNKELGRCELFSYGGCGGNSNNFESQEECVAHCGGPSEGIFHSIRANSIQPLDSVCLLSVNKGSCQATLRRFHFNAETGTCELFIFGGCQGNANNFETMEECLNRCSGPPISDTEASLISPLTSSTEILGDDLSLRNQNVCLLDTSFGTCLTVTFRYHYDRRTNSCKRFRYSGCGGNGNNFLTADDCARTCGGLLNVDRRAPAPQVSPRIFEAFKNRSIVANSLETTTRPAITLTTVSSTTPETEEDATEKSKEQIRKNNNLRVRIKQRRRLFTPTRKRFYPGTSTARPKTPETTTTVASESRLSRFSLARRKSYNLAQSKNETSEEKEMTSSSGTTPAPTLATLLSRISSRAKASYKSRSRFKPPPSEIPKLVISTQSSDLESDKSIDEETNSTDEQQLVRTQTSRSVVVRAKSKKMKDKEVQQDDDDDSSSTYPDNRRALFTSRRGFSSSRHHGRRRSSVDTDEEDDDENRENTESSLEDIETSPSSRLSLRTKARPSANKVQVLSAPPSMSGGGLVVIRSFCRHPPVRSSLARCIREEPLFYYDVDEAECKPFYDGHCGRSRNRFRSKEECLSACVIKSKEFSESDQR